MTDYPRGHTWTAGKYVFKFDETGNLVLRNGAGNVIWQSKTGGRGATMLEMQADGNLVMYNDAGRVWATGTGDHPGASLVVQDDGNVVIYTSTKKSIWTTNTVGK